MKIPFFPSSSGKRDPNDPEHPAPPPAATSAARRTLPPRPTESLPNYTEVTGEEEGYEDEEEGQEEQEQEQEGEQEQEQEQEESNYEEFSLPTLSELIAKSGSLSYRPPEPSASTPPPATPPAPVKPKLVFDDVDHDEVEVVPPAIFSVPVFTPPAHGQAHPPAPAHSYAPAPTHSYAPPPAHAYTPPPAPTPAPVSASAPVTEPVPPPVVADEAPPAPKKPFDLKSFFGQKEAKAPVEPVPTSSLTELSTPEVLPAPVAPTENPPVSMDGGTAPNEVALLKQEKEKLLAQIQKLTTKVSERDAAAAIVQAQIQDLTAQVGGLVNENQILTDQSNQLSDALAAKPQGASLGAELFVVKSELATLKGQSAEWEQEKQALQEALAKQQTELAQQKALLEADLRKEKEDALAQQEAAFVQEKAGLESTLVSENRSLSERIAGLEAKLQGQIEYLDAKNSEVDGLAAQLQEIPVLKAQIADLEAKNAELSATPQAEVDELVSQNAGLREEFNRVSLQLENALLNPVVTPDPVMTDLLATVENHTANILMIINNEGQMVWATESYTRSLGYSRADDNAFLTNIHSEDQPAFQEAVNRAFAGESLNLQTRLQKKGGSWAPLEVSLTPILVAGQVEVERLLLQAIDLTEEKALDDALVQAQTARVTASSAQRVQNDFQGLLNQLTDQVSIAKRLSNGQASLNARLGDMEKSLAKAQEVVGQLGNVIFPDTPVSKIRRSTLLEPFLAENAGSLARGTGWRVQYTIPNDLPEVLVDQDAFAVAVKRIVSNSLQCATQGSLQIAAEAIPEDQFQPIAGLEKGNYVLLTVGDNGPGILPKVKTHIFDRFFTTKPGARGMGLNDARSIMERMGGTLTLASNPMAGTIVSFYIPYKEVMVQLASTGAFVPLTRKLRVLLMDDEPMILDILSRMLENLNYFVVTTSDGSQAIAAAVKAKSTGTPFDIILMDLIIPQGLGGADALPTIRQINPSAKIVASSGHLDHPAMRDYKKFGFTALLQKPYKLERLQALLQELIPNGATATQTLKV